MAKRSTKSPKELKAQKSRGRNFNLAEIVFLKANNGMTIEQLAKALNATEGEVTKLREQYGPEPVIVPKSEEVNKMSFIKENASKMTVGQLAVALKTTEDEVNSLIKGYNEANGEMIRKSYEVGKDRRRGVVVATQASSELGDVNNSMTGPQPQGFIKPLKEVPFIFKTRHDAI